MFWPQAGGWGVSPPTIHRGIMHRSCYTKYKDILDSTPLPPPPFESSVITKRKKDIWIKNHEIRVLFNSINQIRPHHKGRFFSSLTLIKTFSYDKRSFLVLYLLLFLAKLIHNPLFSHEIDNNRQLNLSLNDLLSNVLSLVYMSI